MYYVFDNIDYYQPELCVLFTVNVQKKHWKLYLFIYYYYYFK